MGIARFPLGRIVATPGALQALEEASESPGAFLKRHITADWGDLDGHDRRENDRSVIAWVVNAGLRFPKSAGRNRKTVRKHLLEAPQRDYDWATIGHGIAAFGHAKIAALAHELWQATQCGSTLHNLPFFSLFGKFPRIALRLLWIAQDTRVSIWDQPR